jgi:acyl carrier protein
MGLDGVELVMEAEDEFGIDLPDAECERVRTVRDFVDLVERHLRFVLESSCPGRELFDRLRAAWAEEPELDGVRLRPRTSFSDFSRSLAGWWARPRLWESARRAGVGFPRLRRPAVVDVLVLSLFGILAAATVAVAVIGRSPALCFALLVEAWCAAMVLSTLRRGMPPGVVTLGDAVRGCRQMRAHEATELSRGEIEARVIRLVGEQLEIDMDKINLESRLVEDLNMD